MTSCLDANPDDGRLPAGFVPSPGTRPGGYLPNFFDFQPALNFGYARQEPSEPWRQSVDAEGPRANRAALRTIMDHWLGMGISGFRVDMACDARVCCPGLQMLVDGPPYQEELVQRTIDLLIPRREKRQTVQIASRQAARNREEQENHVEDLEHAANTSNFGMLAGWGGLLFGVADDARHQAGVGDQAGDDLALTLGAQVHDEGDEALARLALEAYVQVKTQIESISDQSDAIAPFSLGLFLHGFDQRSACA